MALAVVEGDPSPENDGGGEEVAAFTRGAQFGAGRPAPGPTIQQIDAMTAPRNELKVMSLFEHDRTGFVAIIRYESHMEKNLHSA